MKNFSNDSTKQSFMDEAPGIIRFFFSERCPRWLRIVAAIILLAIFVLPLFLSRKHSLPNEETRAEKILHEQSVVPVGEMNESEMTADSHLSSDTSSLSTTFLPLKGPFPVLISISEGPSKSVWITSVQDVFSYEEQKLVKKLDPPSYEGVFNDELPAITASLIDNNGEMWLGTIDGQVMEYANYDWKVVFKAKEPIGDRIYCLQKFGRSLYIGTAAGLWRWNLESGKLTRFPGFAGQLIRTFLTTASGDLLLAASSGIWKLGEHGWSLYHPTPREQQVTTLVSSGTGELWYGSDMGLTQINGNYNSQAEYLRDSAVSSILPDSSGVWVGLTSLGLRYFDGKQWFALTTKEGLPEGAINQIHIDQDDNFWIGVTGKGAFHAPKAAVLEWITNYPFEDSRPDNSKPRLYKNACKAVETELKKSNVSGDISAVSQNGQPIVFFRNTQVCPTGIGYRSESGVLLLPQGKDLVVYDGNNVQRINVPEKFPMNEFKKLFLDSSGRIWIAREKGVLMFQNGNWNDGTQDPILAQNSVQSFAEDTNNVFWMGTAPPFNEQTKEYTQPSLHAFNGTGWLHRSFEQGLPGYSVTALLPLKSGLILAGTPSSFAFVSTEKIQLPGGRTPPAAPVIGVTEDSAGTLWIVHAFFLKGLSIFSGKKTIHLDEPNALFANNFAGVASDSRDNIWLMSTNGEIGIYSRQVLSQMITATDH